MQTEKIAALEQRVQIGIPEIPAEIFLRVALWYNTFMPKAAATFPTLLPMLPKPSMPKVLPARFSIG